MPSSNPNGHLPTLVVGIDPGSSGGIAVLDCQGTVVVLLPHRKMPTNQDKLKVLRSIKEYALLYPTNGRVRAYIEKVGGFIGGDGGNQASAHTMFAFGQGYGQWLMALCALGIPYKEVIPTTWQKGVGAPKRNKASKTEWKAALKAHALHLYHDVGRDKSITLDTADALLIAHYGYLQEQ